MANEVPVPQGATIGYDEGQSQGQIPNGPKTVPVPAGSTIGYGETQGTNTQPNPEPTSELPSYATGFESGREEGPQVPTSQLQEGERGGVFGATVGAAKGAGSTVATGAELLSKIPGMDKVIPKEGVTALRSMTTPENASEKIGYIAENLGEFFAGDEVLKGLSIAEKLGLAERVAQYAKTSPRVAAIINHGMTAARQAVVVGGQTFAHTGDVGESVKAGLTAGAIGAITGAGVEGAGALKDVLKDTLDTGIVQKPLIEGVRTAATKAAIDVGGTSTAVPRLTYQESPTGELGNMDRKVTTKVGDTVIGSADAQTTGANGEVVTIRGNNISDPVNRARGYGKAQLNRMITESAKGGKVKFINSDMSTSSDAQNVWKSLQRDFPDAVKRTDFPDKGRSQWTLDVGKWKEANGPEVAKQYEAGLQPVAEHPSITKNMEQAADAVYGMSKNDYDVLDEATNGRFQQFRDKAFNSRRQLQDLGTSEDDYKREASILKGLKDNEDSMREAFAEARAKGVDPALINRADANFRKSQAMYELDSVIKRAHTAGMGGTEGVSSAEYLKHRPEKLDLPYMRNRIETMFKSGRLSDALGDQGARDMLNQVNDAHLKETHILRNQHLAKYGGYAAGAAGLGAAAHYGPAAIIAGSQK
jgi:hypothetical protein